MPILYLKMNSGPLHRMFRRQWQCLQQSLCLLHMMVQTTSVLHSSLGSLLLRYHVLNANICTVNLVHPNGLISVLGVHSFSFCVVILTLHCLWGCFSFLALALNKTFWQFIHWSINVWLTFFSTHHIIQRRAQSAHVSHWLFRS